MLNTPAPSSFDPATRIGTVVAGKYRLERLLGTGGMGAVYEAVHTGVQRRFAVKVMTADPTRSPEGVRRFTQEAQAAGLIGHPHIVEVFDLGESSDGSLYMVMELLKGQTLHEALRDGPLQQSDAVAIALELLRALDAAHRAGIVHRDIKPQNLFLADRPDHGSAALKVLDFGIAKFHEVDTSTITRSGAIVGTPLYMAPEQVLSDRAIDGRADVWAAGATLFEMLTGRPVHLAPHAAAAAVRIVTEVASRVRTLRPEIDEELDGVVARALSISREDRYASAADMIDALEPIAARLHNGERQPMVTPTAPARIPSSSHSGVSATPLKPATAFDQKRATSAKSGLVIFGALALVGGATAGSLFIPIGGTTPIPKAPLAAISAASRQAGRETEPGNALGSAASTDVSAVSSSQPAALAASVTAEGGVDTPVGETTPVGQTVQSASATGTALAPVAPSKKPIKKPESATKTEPKTAPGAPSSPPAALACGPRESESNGHCCPRGLVWQVDKCDRPLAKSF